MDDRKYNKFIEIEEELENFDFSEKIDILRLNYSPDFFLELRRGSPLSEFRRIIIDDEKISKEVFNEESNENEPSEQKIIDDENIINKVKDIVINNLKDIIKISLKLSPEYIMTNGMDNTYTDYMLLKYGNLILIINNGPIGDEEADKILNSIFNIINLYS